MGLYSDYLNEFGNNWSQVEKERKTQLLQISKFRGDRAILAIAAAITKPGPTGIDYDDRMRIFDQVSNLKGDKIDIILETPGGLAEVVEDVVQHIRRRFTEVAMIIPGYAKSVGTIMVMAGDEILMEPSSALGPIDAQIVQPGKRFSAQAFLDGLDKIKQEVVDKGYLNHAYVPILQNISPGEIQNCENVLDFGKELVTQWLSKYKFKFWETHSSTGKPVTEEEKKQRAGEIADILCDHNRWFSHGRSIYIKDLVDEMKLEITDYSKKNELSDAIRRYFILLKISFDITNIIKIFETPDTQIYFHFQVGQSAPQIPPEKADSVLVDVVCPNCENRVKIQANLKKNVPVKKGAIPFPKDSVFLCPKCDSRIDLSSLRGQIESQAKKKVV